MGHTVSFLEDFLLYKNIVIIVTQSLDFVLLLFDKKSDSKQFQKFLIVLIKLPNAVFHISNSAIL